MGTVGSGKLTAVPQWRWQPLPAQTQIPTVALGGNVAAPTDALAQANAAAATAAPAVVAAIAPTAASRQLALLTTSTTVIAVIAVLAICWLARPLLVPILIAALLAIGLSPIMTALSKVMPRSLSAAVVLLLILSFVFAIASIVAAPAQDWIANAPEHLRDLRRALSGLTASLAQANQAAQGLNAIAGNPTPAPRVPALNLWDALAVAPGLLIAFGTVLLLAYFFLVYGPALMRRIVQLSPTFTRKKRVVGICRTIRHDTARYLLVTCSINAGLGVATATILWAFGIPDPVLWGVAASLANLVPYLGASCIALLLTMVGVLHAPGSIAGLYPAAAFVLVAIIEGNFLTPTILGWQLRLSPLAILVWLMLFGWLWGLPGLLIAVPTLMCVKIICSRIEAWRWVAKVIDA